MTELTQQFMQFVNSTLEATREELSMQKNNASTAAVEIQRLSTENARLVKDMEEFRLRFAGNSPFAKYGGKRSKFNTKYLRIDPYNGDKACWKKFAATI